MSNLVYVCILLIVSFPLAIALAPMIAFKNSLFQILWLFFIPFVFVFSYILVSGLLSKLGVKGIISGKFPREPKHPIYSLRRIYGSCWTAVYYFKPLYWLVLSLPFLKKITFRLFGYENGMNFTIYPDTWIRDLPLLSFGKKTYIANRATLGTNMCLNDHSILVDSITLEEKTMIGHLAMIGPGVSLGSNSEVGTGGVIGVKVKAGKNVKIGALCAISHGTVLEDNVNVGSVSSVGLRSVIRSNINLPFGSNIPAGAIIETQKDVEKYFSSETELLALARLKTSNLINSFISKSNENENIA